MTVLRATSATIALLLLGCGDQGPTDDQAGVLRGVWRVWVDSTMALPYSRDSHCAIFDSDGSLVYEIRNYHPEGRPADSLGRLQRFLGSFQRRADSLEWSATRWVRYSWLQHRTSPIVADTVVTGVVVDRLDVSDSALTIQGQPAPFRLLARDPTRADLCGPLP